MTQNYKEQYEIRDENLCSELQKIYKDYMNGDISSRWNWMRRTNVIKYGKNVQKA